MKKRKITLSTLSAQLLVYMVSLLAAVLLLTVILSSYLNTKALDEQANNFTSQMLVQIQTNIDGIVATAKNITQYLAEDEAVLGFLRLQDFYAEDRILLETTARDAMRKFSRNNPQLIGGMLIVGENGLYASGEMYRTSRHSLLEESWYQQAVKANGETLLLSKPIGRNLQNYRNYGAMDIVSLVRALYDSETGACLGVICMDLQLSVIEDYIRNITLGKDGYVFIIDADESIVYAPINDTVYRIRVPWLQSDSNQFYRIGEKHYQLLSTYSTLTDWRIVGVFNSDTVLEPVKSIRSYSLMIGIAVILITGIISLLLSSSFTRPISRLEQLMQKAEKGDLTVSFDAAGYCDEIANLGNSFNTMIGQLHHLMDMVVEEQKLKREAEIKTLQAQIKPHFLYNALDTIRWMAEEHKAEDVSMMVTALTKLFRIGLSRGHEVIDLNAELEHVSNYLYIQKVRYEDKLNYQIRCDDGLLACKVNKLILQPLVENSIYHGIKQKRGAGMIEVHGYASGETLVLSVTDDGVGMSSKQCDELNAALRDEAKKSYHQGYGIFNVNDRIRLTHGSSYGLFYHINETGGMTVNVILPLKQSASIAKLERSIKDVE